MEVTIQLPEYVDCPNDIWVIDPSWTFSDLLIDIFNDSWISGSHGQVDISLYKLQCQGQDVMDNVLVFDHCQDGHTVVMMRK